MVIWRIPSTSGEFHYGDVSVTSHYKKDSDTATGLQTVVSIMHEKVCKGLIKDVDKLR